MGIKKLKLIAKIIAVFSLLMSVFVNPVFANNYAEEPKAVERYTRTVNVACHNRDWGYITAKVTISHNMTTGCMTVASATAEGHFNLGWPGVRYKSIVTNPAVGSVINGSAIKVTVYYVNLFDLSSSTWHASDCIYI